MTIVKGFLSTPTVFCAEALKVYVPVVVGVPEMTPVDSASVNPGGRIPTPQIIGVVPVAARVVMYEIPRTPFGSEVVVMTGGVSMLVTVSVPALE